MMHSDSRSCDQLVLARGLLLLFAATSCVQTRPWRQQTPPWTAAMIENASEARFDLPDGTHTHLRKVRAERVGQVVFIAGKFKAADGKSLTDERYELATLTDLEIRKTEATRVIANVGIGVGAIILVFYALFGLYAVPPTAG